MSAGLTIKANFHVIAGPEDNVQVGDEIEFEPYGLNFGWFKRKVDTR
jgi:hypothetical protein